MNIKPALRYQLNDFKWAIPVYYLVIILLYVFSLTLVYVRNDTTVTINGFESSSMIVLFVLGICTCREPLRLSVQNGISRRSHFVAHLLTMIVICALLAVCDRCLQSLAALLAGNLPQADFYGSLVALIYRDFFTPLSGFSGELVTGLFCFLSYLALFAAGYLISLAYYRMNKAAKIVVSVGVPLLLVAGVPLLDFGVLNGAITAVTGRFFMAVMGLNSGNLWIGMASLFVAVLVLNAVCYLLLRRAPLK